MPALSAAASKFLNATDLVLWLRGFVVAFPEAYAVQSPNTAGPLASGPTAPALPGVTAFTGCVLDNPNAWPCECGMDNPTCDAASLSADCAGPGSVLVAAAAAVTPRTPTVAIAATLALSPRARMRFVRTGMAD